MKPRYKALIFICTLCCIIGATGYGMRLERRKHTEALKRHILHNLERIGITSAEITDFAHEADVLLNFFGDDLLQALARISPADIQNLYSNRWQTAPIDKTFKAKLFGGSIDSVNYEGLLISDTGFPHTPDFNSDYMYYFENKQEKQDKMYDIDFFMHKEHFSYNFIFCIINMRTFECLYYESDT